MLKYLQFPTKTEKGIFLYLLDQDLDHLTKTAAEYHPEIAAYINNPKKLPGKTQVLLTALGAAEFWGPNVNGDAFFENDLAYSGDEYGFKTFEKNAKVYKHHMNKFGQDPHYGDVVLAVYNPIYHRVELIVAIDNIAGKEIVDRVNSGDYPDWSMGARVKFDICSNCSNQAKTRKEYCSCLKFYMNKIHPTTGKHVFAINPKPRFFDISYVLIGADRTSKTHMKVAFLLGNRYKNEQFASSAEMGELVYGEKTAEMDKEIPGDPGENAPDTEQTLEGILELRAREKSLPKDTLDNLASSYPASKVLSTMLMMGILPKPQETQRIVIVSAGHKPLADMLDKCNVCFDPMDDRVVPSKSSMSMISHELFTPEIMGALKGHLEDRSAYQPFLNKRMLLMIKNMPKEDDQPTLIKVGGFFNNDKFNQQDKPKEVKDAIKYMALAALIHGAIGRKAPLENLSGMDKVFAKYPGFMAALGLSGAMFFNQLMKDGNPRGQERGAFQMEGEIPNHLKFAMEKVSKQTTKLMAGTTLPFLISSGLNKRYKTDPEYREGMIKKFVRKNPDIVAGLALADSLAGLHGGGTTGLYRKGKKWVDPVFKAFRTKVAQDQNLSLQKLSSEKSKSDLANQLSSGLVWPMAFGRVGAPVRVIGNLVDQALFAGIGKATKALSKNQDKTKIK